MTNTDLTILEILKTSKDLGKNQMQIQNIDHLLGRKGEREYIGARLFSKLENLVNKGFLKKENDYFSITDLGLDYLDKNSKE